MSLMRRVVGAPAGSSSAVSGQVRSSTPITSMQTVSATAPTVVSSSGAVPAGTVAARVISSEVVSASSYTAGYQPQAVLASTQATTTAAPARIFTAQSGMATLPTTTSQAKYLPAVAAPVASSPVTISATTMPAKVISAPVSAVPMTAGSPVTVLPSAGRTVQAPTWKLKLGAEVPNFFCKTTTGDFWFHDFVTNGPEYTLLFSHPRDFTPVCTTELGRCEQYFPEFAARSVQLCGISCDPVEEHRKWSVDVLARAQIKTETGQLSFPIIADDSRDIVTTLGMLDPEEKNEQGVPLPARALYVLDKTKKVKLAIVYPATTGRNFDELLRVIDSLTLTKDVMLATPADWRQGDRCIVGPAVKTEDARERFEDLIIEDLPSGKQYLRTVKCPGAAPAGRLIAGSGFSNAESNEQAVREAIQTALDAGNIQKPSMIFAACTSDRNVAEVQGLFAQFLPDAPIHGITSSNNVLMPNQPVPNGVGCLILEAPPDAFTPIFADDAAQAFEAAKMLADSGIQLQAVIMSTVPGSEEQAIADIQQALGNIPIYGGTAADNDLSGAWRVFGSTGCSEKGISIVGIGSSIKIGASMMGPYAPTTVSAKMTKAEGRRVFEIDNAPAADWVYRWLGQDVEDAYQNGGMILPQTAQKPIGFALPSGQYITGHLAGLGGAEKYVDFFCPVTEGADMVVMDSGDGPQTGYAQTLSDAVDEALQAGQLQAPSAGLLIYCGGMSIAVGEQLQGGLEAGLAPRIGNLPFLGMTCFGEQAYMPQDQATVQRNLSMGVIFFE